MRSARRLRRGNPSPSSPTEFDARRRERVQFVVDFSRDATDTMLPGADPVAGTMRKLEPLFQDRLRRLYRDTPRAGA